MGDSTAVRAIIVGASVLIALVTITAVIAYYNTAIDAVRKIGPGVDLAKAYRQDIETSLTKSSLTGTEAKNLVSYFYKIPRVRVIFTNLPILNNQTSGYNNLKYSNANVEVVDEATFNRVTRNILPAHKYKLVKTENKDVTILTLTLT